jgi:hypothetical protein
MTKPQNKPILGHIDCPTCASQLGMRITHDRNGDPFGYCEHFCGQQLRIGGSSHRVSKFLARYPWAARSPHVQAPSPVPAPVTVTEANTQTNTQTPPKRRSSMDDALAMLGVTA